MQNQTLIKVHQLKMNKRAKQWRVKVRQRTLQQTGLSKSAQRSPCVETEVPRTKSKRPWTEKNNQQLPITQNIGMRRFLCSNKILIWIVVSYDRKFRDIETSSFHGMKYSSSLTRTSAITLPLDIASLNYINIIRVCIIVLTTLIKLRKRKLSKTQKRT